MIHYIPGDATAPQGAGTKVLVHCVNDIGAWGAGFVLALDKRWPIVGRRYREWHRAQSLRFALGEVQFVRVEPDVWVANLVGQHRTGFEGGVPPVRYDALRTGFRTVAEFCAVHAATVHAPRLGAGLAGGDWHTIEGLLDQEIAAAGVPVTVYDWVK